MLAMQMLGKIDSWAIRWAYTHFKQDAFALLSLRPRVFHIGADRTATIRGGSLLSSSGLRRNGNLSFSFQDTTRLEESFVLELQRSLRPSLARKLVRYLLHGRVRMAATRVDLHRGRLRRRQNIPQCRNQLGVHPLIRD